MATSFSSGSTCNMRIGFAKDIHQLVENRPLILAGVNIPFTKGLKGHSDADVVYHAVSEALLGALALGDLGHHFPDNDAQFKDANSQMFVDYCHQLIVSKGYLVNNIDVTIECEKPKLAPYIAQMRTNIANLLDVEITDVSVKAGTREQLDSVGQGLAIEATAIVLLRRVNHD